MIPNREKCHNSISIQRHQKLRDVFVAFFLVLCVLVLATASIDGSCYWGDDYAAYISQGIAIAEGRFEQQARLNALMHPSLLPLEAEGGELVYVWGYSLLLAAIYKVVGFDRLSFSSIIYYKLPSVLALALLAGLLYYFYHRRFGFRLSFLFALLFCCCSEMFDFLNTLYSDLVFLFFAMLSLYLCEIFCETGNGRERIAIGIALGAALWFMYEIRLNGVSILLACVLAHFISLRKNSKREVNKSILVEFVPYLFFAMLLLLSRLFFASATPNTSDIGNDMSITLFCSNIMGYLRLIVYWFELLWDSLLISPMYSVLRRLFPIGYESLSFLRSVLATLSLLLCVIGLIFNRERKNAHLGIYLLAYILFASMLPYTQGLRYIYPILPLLLMFAGYGLLHVKSLAVNMLSISKNYPTFFSFTCLICCVLVLYPRVSAAFSGDKGINEIEQISSASDVYMQNAYSPCAVELYNFARTDTDPDSVIAFFAPRALYLNTQRISIRPGVNGHSIDEADYCLRYLKVGSFPVDPIPDNSFRECFANEEFILYERIQ